MNHDGARRIKLQRSKLKAVLKIQDILRKADVDGLIKNGAPPDEYDSYAGTFYELATRMNLDLKGLAANISAEFNLAFHAYVTDNGKYSFEGQPYSTTSCTKLAKQIQKAIKSTEEK